MPQDGPVTTSPDSPIDLPRPSSVSVAYWLWMFAAVVLVFSGLLIATTSGDVLRTRLVDLGTNADSIDGLIRLIRGIGVVSLLVGVVVGFLSGAVKAGDARYRRALVTLSGIFAVLQIATVLLGLSPTYLLLVPILLITASVVVYRQAAAPWFSNPQESDDA